MMICCWWFKCLALHVKLEFMSLATDLTFNIFNGGWRVHDLCKNLFCKLCTMIFFCHLDCSTFGLIVLLIYVEPNNIEWVDMSTCNLVEIVQNI